MSGLLDPARDWSAPTAELLVITPDEARTVRTERDTRAEPINRYRGAELADQMRRGLWRVNGETITFWPDGSIRNGRHRLYACAGSGVPLRTWVIFGTDPEESSP